ncbi:MAG: branched-chain amino acid dehydrogenase, partial [Spirochaetales bacterium]|nr:branched-chain amino acid dehydrogenase [Spirochaetales bacterium]
EDGKQVITLEGREYLLELPIRGDFTLIRAAKADKAGNLTFSASARNFAPLMAMAGDTVIVEADEIVEIGTLDPETVVTPGIFVDYIVQRGE